MTMGTPQRFKMGDNKWPTSGLVGQTTHMAWGYLTLEVCTEPSPLGVSRTLQCKGQNGK